MRYKAELMRDEMAYAVTDREGDAVVLGYFSQARARDIAGALNAAYEEGAKAGYAASRKAEAAPPVCCPSEPIDF